MTQRIRLLTIGLVAVAAAVGWYALGPLPPVRADVVLKVEPITWNIIGLDSNNVSVGPNYYPVGARVCNTGSSAATNVTATFVQDSTNTHISLGGNSTVSIPSLPNGLTSHPPGNTGPIPANCADFYFNVVINRTSAAYNTTLRYHIEVTADEPEVGIVSTPANRELYVEKLVSQNRNEVLTFTGETNVLVGHTYRYTMTASTATNGYEQLVASVGFPNYLFQVVSVSVSYGAPPGATNNASYANACGWDPNIGLTPPQGTYRSCVGPPTYPGGKVGSSITMIYTVKVLSAGSATLKPLIYDYSGSSYHYNSDYGIEILAVTASNPTAITLASFTATPLCRAVLLEWETATEIDALGFNLYRSQSITGPRRQLNGGLIPAQAPGSVLGAVYAWLDDGVETDITYHYWLEDVGTYGITTEHGPITATPLRCPLGVHQVFLPFISR